MVELEGDVELVVPRGYRATVLLRRVDEGNRIRYSWLAIQYALADSCVSASYKHTDGEDTVQVYLEEGTPLSSESLKARLIANAGDPPIVIDSM